MANHLLHEHHKVVHISNKEYMSMSGAMSLAATSAAMAQLDATSAATTTMNAQAQSTKMVTDTMAAITSGFQDSATKVQNAMQQAGKSINY